MLEPCRERRFDAEPSAQRPTAPEKSTPAASAPGENGNADADGTEAAQYWTHFQPSWAEAVGALGDRWHAGVHVRTQTVEKPG
jgi:hypothetical protein